MILLLKLYIKLLQRIKKALCFHKSYITGLQKKALVRWFSTDVQQRRWLLKVEITGVKKGTDTYILNFVSFIQNQNLKNLLSLLYFSELIHACIFQRWIEAKR